MDKFGGNTILKISVENAVSGSWCRNLCKCVKINARLIAWTFITLAVASHFSTAKIVLGEESICKTTEIVGPKDNHMLYKLLNCEVIEGSLTIANVNFSKVNLREPSPLREITGYLLIYRAYHLESLEVVFPHLAVIRGDNLFGEYALVIHENWDLQNIGLTSLVTILKGSVRITKNPQLCYVHTINWFQILLNMKNQHFVLKNNRNQNHCPLCYNDKNKRPGQTDIYCWDYKKYQRICPKKCGKGSCDSSGRCCHEQCLGGCFDISNRMCKICRNFKDDKGECVKTCDSHSYSLANRRCVSAETCEKMRMIPFGEVCTSECPSGWVLRNKRCTKCDPPCVEKTCDGRKIRNAAEAKQLLNCTHIKGSLEIQLVEKRTNIVAELTKYLSNIIEISGYLRVRNSPQLTSLSFFKNLKKIVGTELEANEYALVVAENYHLESIWNKDQTVEIENGMISFHFNPKLCFEKIEELIPSIKSLDNRKLFVNDISPYSNGDLVVCGPNLTNLTVEVELVNATAVRIKLRPLVFEDKRIFLGYIYYYTETLEEDLSIFDNRHGCGYDRWKSELDLTKNVRHVITNLKPYTKYGLFVKTFTVSDAHLQKEAYSEIIYFQTLSWKPGPISKFYANLQGGTNIDLHWWPPNNPNGPIEYYLVKVIKILPIEQHRELEAKRLIVAEEIIEPEYENVEVEIYNRKLLDTRVNITLNCKCSDEDYWRGYTPIHHEYYDEAEVIFEDAVADFVFVPTDPSEIRIVNKTDSSKPLTNSQKQELFNRRLEEEERRALAEYDTGTADFPITIPQKECHFGKCLAEEIDISKKLQDSLTNTTVLSGSTHHYSPPNLEPNTKYRISIRACVEGDFNMCGPETALNITTLNSMVFPQ